DIRWAISNLPVEIDGVETDPVEVVVHRHLKRVSTDRVRGGALRVLNDGIIGRAHKIGKVLKELNISGWEWSANLKGGTKESATETTKASAHFEEVISGRAVLSAPNTRGGLRIRYGRSLNTGLSTLGIHPAVATLLDDPVVAGTQVKVDIPGKAGTIAFVDSIEGPTVLLKDGSVRRVNSVLEAEKLHDNVIRILDMGDALISFGDFLENNKPFAPSPYVQEWWIQDFGRAIKVDGRREALLSMMPATRLDEIIANSTPTPAESINISRILGIPLNPYYSPRFDRLLPTELIALRDSMRYEGRDMSVEITSHHTEILLQKLLIPYVRLKDSALIDPDWSTVLAELLKPDQNLPSTPYESSLELVKGISGITVGKQTTATVGVRVGRPEKAMLRHLKPPVHVLFPVGYAGGTTRDLLVASKKGYISADVVNLICPSCAKRRLSSRCHDCSEGTIPFLSCPRCGQILKEDTRMCPNCRVEGTTHSNYEFDLKLGMDSALEKVHGLTAKPIKGVRGLSSRSK
ncbi:MAG: DNA polymerase II large subunit, partial [Nitrososphaerales archaeon]